MYQDYIYDIKQEGQKVSFLFKGSCQDAALCRQHIRNKIYSYMIDQVTFFTNTSQHTEEDLAKRFGLLIPHQQESKGVLKIKGPKMVMCHDIEGITFVYNMPLVYLKEKEELYCHLLLKKGCGDMHQKWNPVAGITFCDVDFNIYQFSFELIGSLTWDDIKNQL